MFKKLLGIALISFFTTSSVYASDNTSVNISVNNNTANISINGIEKDVKSLQLNIVDENGNKDTSFYPSKDFKYSNVLEEQSSSKTNISVLIDDKDNLFEDGTLNLGSLNFKSTPKLSEDVTVELFNIKEGLESEVLSVKANITYNTSSNNTSSNTSTSSSSSSSTSSSAAYISTADKIENTVTENTTSEETKTSINIDSMFPIVASPNFTDIANHWANAPIMFLAERGIINGISSSEFAPNDNITRAQFVTLLAKMDNIEESNFKSEGLNDVPTDAWFSPYVGWAMENGITSGVGENNFAPNDTITREQMAVMIKRFSDYKNFSLDSANEKKDFSDENEIASYAKEAIVVVQQAGIINGRTDGTFAPKDNATRGEASQMLYTLLIIQ